MSETFQVGDAVRFEGEYTRDGGQHLEPRNPQVIITTNGRSRTVKPDRAGVGVYYTVAVLGEVGETIVQFTGAVAGGHEVHSERVFRVVEHIDEASRFMPVSQPAVQDRDRLARQMMVNDLKAAGIAISDSHSDTVVASAHAAMLERRERMRRDERAKPRPLAPLRPSNKR